MTIQKLSSDVMKLDHKSPHILLCTGNLSATPFLCSVAFPPVRYFFLMLLKGLFSDLFVYKLNVCLPCMPPLVVGRQSYPVRNYLQPYPATLKENNVKKKVSMLLLDLHKYFILEIQTETVIKQNLRFISRLKS